MRSFLTKALFAKILRKDCIKSSTCTMKHNTTVIPHTHRFQSLISAPIVFLLTSRSFRLPLWFASILAIIGTAWRPPQSSIGLLAIFLILLVVAEWLSRRLTIMRIPSSLNTPSKATLSKTAEPDAAETMDDTILQQMIRSKTAEGLDRLDGTFCVEFPAEVLTATVHIPFCPAFEHIPKVQVFPADESLQATLRITSPKTYGVRVDVKRNNAASDRFHVDRFHFAVIAEG